MRYWCEFDNKGREFWVFETINDREVLPNRGNHVFFWVIQGFFAGAYIVITIYELVLLRFSLALTSLFPKANTSISFLFINIDTHNNLKDVLSSRCN